ncbi:MAG: GUN4 domain-containing protein [Okeania sp. SIO2D1]|nr:GUN4 domain-containing protein [Okeania sp. SIO2D1]
MVILRLAGYSRRSAWLKSDDVAKISCQDLSTIDKLWLKYSKGNFGFSVQKQIYRSLGGMRGLDARRAYEVWKKFGDRVGWPKGGKWLLYKRLTYSRMRRGFLPIRMNVAGGAGSNPGLAVRNGRFWRVLSRYKSLYNLTYSCSDVNIKKFEEANFTVFEGNVRHAIASFSNH